MTATFRSPSGTIIEAAGTPEEIAALASALPRGFFAGGQNRLSEASASAITEPAQFFKAVTCTCGRVDGCPRHPWLHRRVSAELPLRN